MFKLNGGWNYSGLHTSSAVTLEEAAAEWYDRYSSNGLRRIEGFFYPCWGDMEDTEYAVVNYETEETMTRAEVMRMYA